MPVKRDASVGKNYEGPVFGGEGKDGAGYKSQSSYEFTGVYKSGPNPKLTTVDKGFTSARDGKEESRTFSGTQAGYAGPQRISFKPTDLGERHPDDLQHS